MYPKVANISTGFFPVYKIAVDSNIKKSPYFILAVISVLYKISIIGSAPYQVLLIQHKIQTGMSHFLTIWAIWRFQLKHLSKISPRNLTWEDGLIVMLSNY